MNKVKLVSITKPVIDGVDTAEELVSYCARVSNPENQNNKLTSKKLLRYLINNKHWSPFEMSNIVMEIETTRDIGRQLLRHRSFSFQEFSQRYQKVDSLGFTRREARLQDSKNRQNSIDTDDQQLKDKWDNVQDIILSHAESAYNWALDNGIAKEQARCILPEGLTMSRMYVNGTLRSWIHYCNLRMEEGTQKEHRELAEMCWNIILENFPSLNDMDK